MLTLGLDVDSGSSAASSSNVPASEGSDGKSDQSGSTTGATGGSTKQST